jgi:GT2 family glycosyltransferase
VIIVNWNGKHLLKGCLDSVLANNPSEIIMVDNASTEGSIEFVRKHYPTVKVIVNHLNLGFAMANNIGAAQAKGDCLVFLNNDTIVTDDWLNNLLEPFKDDIVGAVGSKLLFYDKPAQINSVGIFVSTLGFNGSLGDGRPKHEFNEQIRLFAPSGGSFAIRKNLYDAIGGFNESFFMYEEDTELGFKIHYAGYNVVLAPKSIAYHKCLTVQKPIKYYYLTRNRLSCYWMHAGKWMWLKGILFSVALMAAFTVTMRFDKATQVFHGLIDVHRLMTMHHSSLRGDEDGLCVFELPRHTLSKVPYTSVKDSLSIASQKFWKHIGVRL